MNRTISQFLTAATAAALLAASGSAQLIGVDFDNGEGSPTNWNTFNIGTPGNLNNLIDESGASTGVSFAMASGSPFTTAASAATVPQHSNPLNLIGDYYFSTGIGMAEFRSLIPGQDYFVWVFGLRGFTMNNRITILGGGAPIQFDQVGTAGQVWVNSELGDSNRTLQSYAVIQSADANGFIRFEFDIVPGGSAGWTIAGIAIEVVPTPGALALLGIAGFLGRRRRRN